MRKVTTCHNSEKEHAFTELVNALRTINVAREDANKYNIELATGLRRGELLGLK